MRRRHAPLVELPRRHHRVACERDERLFVVVTIGRRRRRAPPRGSTDRRSVRTTLRTVRRSMRIRGHDAVVFARKPIFGGIHQLPEGILLRRARREFSERTLCVLADRIVLPRARNGRGVLFLPSFGEDFGIFEVERRRRGRDVVGVWERRPGYFRADCGS